MELETINKLYLELSQIATAKTKRELELEELLTNAKLRDAGESGAVRGIESAPKDGTEILVWREDAGWLLARWIAPCDFLHERELERMELKDAEEPDWFYADFISGGRLDGGNPTHWLPMPDAPTGWRCAMGPLLPASGYPSVEADGDGYIIRLDDACNWHHLTKEEAKQLCTALMEDGPGAAKHLMKLTIG